MAYRVYRFSICPEMLNISTRSSDILLQKLLAGVQDHNHTI